MHFIGLTILNLILSDQEQSLIEVIYKFYEEKIHPLNPFLQEMLYE